MTLHEQNLHKERARRVGTRAKVREQERNEKESNDRGPKRPIKPDETSVELRTSALKPGALQIVKYRPVEN